MTGSAATVPSPAAGLAPSALDLLGNAPLVALDRVHAGPGRILAKAEFMRPGGRAAVVRASPLANRPP